MITNFVDRLADRIRWGYFTAFLLLLISYILTFTVTRKLLEESNKVDHTNKVMINLDLLQSSITDGESSARGYLTTIDNNFLDLYEKGPEKTDSFFKEVGFLVTDNPLQVKRLDTLRSLISDKWQIMNKGVKLFRADNYAMSDSLKSMMHTGKAIMDEIRLMCSNMQETEKQLMSIRNNQLKSWSQMIKLINIISLIVAILLAFYSIVTFNKENRAKQQADRNAAAFRNQLEARIDELKQLNSELVELKSIEKFASTGRIARTIAHEVRNPLTNINLAAEHLKSEISPNSETDLLIEMITRNSNRINQLISDLLNSTKASLLHFVDYKVNDLLDESLKLALDRIDLKGIKVIKKYDPDVCPILADSNKIQIAFLNIIVNAIEAMEPNNGVLKIKTENREKRCVITISDNGKGMNDEELSNLFEPYYTTKENGTGLGLTNTQNIILSHKASISAESTPGKGTTFTISFGHSK